MVGNCRLTPKLFDAKLVAALRPGYSYARIYLLQLHSAPYCIWQQSQKIKGHASLVPPSSMPASDAQMGELKALRDALDGLERSARLTKSKSVWVALDRVYKLAQDCIQVGCAVVAAVSCPSQQLQQ